MSKLFRYTLIVIVAVSIPVMLFSLGVYYLITPVSAAVSTVIGIVYAVVLTLLLRMTPIWPKAPGRDVWWVLAALLWGSAVSFAIVSFAALPALELAAVLDWQASVASFGGAWPEEAIKGIGVLFVLMSFRQFTRPWHGFVVGMLVGLGFEAFENILYGASMGIMHPMSDMLGMLQIWGLRSIALPFLHIVWTGLLGWGIGLALYTAGRSLAWRLGVVAGWFALAFGLHFAWNYMDQTMVAMVIKGIVVAVVMFGAWFYVWRTAWRGARHDDTLVRTDGAFTQLEHVGGIFDPPKGDVHHTIYG